MSALLALRSSPARALCGTSRTPRHLGGRGARLNAQLDFCQDPQGQLIVHIKSKVIWSQLRAAQPLARNERCFEPTFGDCDPRTGDCDPRTVTLGHVSAWRKVIEDPWDWISSARYPDPTPCPTVPTGKSSKSEGRDLLSGSDQTAPDNLISKSGSNHGDQRSRSGPRPTVHQSGGG